jgi:non-ribosomal peptide synthetase component E (peptide arylation enzyme)
MITNNRWDFHEKEPAMSIPTLFAARLEQHAQRAHGAPAIAIAGRAFDYREVLAEVENCAAWLARCGCAPSEVVGVATSPRARRPARCACTGAPTT